jgi:outer membrane protein assembly factor BamB
MSTRWRAVILPLLLAAAIAAVIVAGIHWGGAATTPTTPDALHRPEPTLEEMADWRCAGRDAGHRGWWAGELESLPEECWRYELGRRSLAAPIVADGVVYFGGEEGDVVALSLADGAELWRVELGGPVRGAPAWDGERLYPALGRGALVALDPQTGAELWRAELSGPVDTGPTPYGNLLYLGDEAGVLHAVDRLTGENLWSHAGAAPILSHPAVDAETVYYADQAGVVHALDRLSGVERWRVRLESRVYGGVVLDGERLFAVSRTGQVAALNAVDGTLLAQTDVGHPPVGLPVVGDEHLLLATDRARLYRLDINELVGRWEVKLGDYPGGGPLAVGGVVVCPTWFGKLRAYGLGEGELLWELDSPGAFCDAPPAFDETTGTLVVLYQDGTLIAYGR